MIFPHTEKANGTIQPVIAWALCECGQKHRIMPGIEKPYWWCSDEIISLDKGDEIDVEYVEDA